MLNFKVLTFFALIFLMSQIISAIPLLELHHFIPRSNLEKLEDLYLPHNGKRSIYLSSYYAIS